MDDRENEIQKLCKSVLDMSANFYNNPNGADTTTCPLCSKTVYGDEVEMSGIPHKPECGYLIAKDLSTNIKQQ